MTFEEIEKRMIKKQGLSEKMFKALKPAFEAVFEAGKDSALTELNNQGGKIMHEKLLPCPFCGKEAKIITGYNNGAYFSIVCTGCHVSLCQRSYDNSFQPSETKDGKKAILEWNTRTIAALRFELTKAREKIGEYHKALVQIEAKGLGATATAGYICSNIAETALKQGEK